MKWLSYSSARWIILLLVCVETACGTYFTRNNPELRDITSVLYFACGLLIALFPIFRYSSDQLTEKPGRLKILKQLVIGAFFIYALWYAIPHLYWVFDFIKIDYRNADMIPQIKVCCQRWLAGQQVYAPMPEIWNGMLPTYLPMMWMPYIPLQLLNVDVRWTTVFFFMAGIALLMWMLARSAKVNWIQLLLILMMIGNLIFIQTDYNRIFFGWTQEGLVVGYYLFLGFALTRKNPWITGIAITCCLLSRYALFFWIPAYLLFYFFTGHRKKALLEASVIFVLTVIIFIIPYFIRDPYYFLLLPEKYSSQVKEFWRLSQHEISESLGLGKFFSVAQFELVHWLEMGLSLFIPAIFYLLLYRFRKHPLINLTFAGLCGLKLTLTFFYGFLEAPQFYYLYMVPTLFSYPILFHFLNPESQTAYEIASEGKNQ